jgi:hypothetical protein
VEDWVGDDTNWEYCIMNYRVTWEIDIEADSALEAAEEALEIQRRPDSIATVFTVRDETDQLVIVDLDDDSYAPDDDHSMPGADQ